ncbi:hypothetical protein PLESTB_000591800 [Pleodorina starrii]|uniref:Uncharacterized protein n=1 Tax=Pleodorina starrii TaxID=330485 RepID=A0A9W6BIG4_9CHLO|nr:hypothetical protein PLESTM_000765100 [Pleodorina starrii]GLC52177.1 hypothetical protein PLESTB_000591800 [Pleodorina starrii]GLC75808.1 hypothetical protein PLESTF_001689900 [Pleodorina starrii]
MARIIVQAAVAVALLAAVLQYVGVTPSIPGVRMLFPRLGGTASRRNINAPKLLADLNSDRMEAAEAATPGGGDMYDTRVARAASAALSVMYLASLPGLKEEVKQTPGIVQSLLRRVLTLDLTEVQRSLLQQQQQQGEHQGEQPPQRSAPEIQQGQAQQQGLQASELLSSALLALAKLATGDPAFQAWLLGESDASAIAAVTASGKRMPSGALLTRLGEILRSGVPAWQAAASVLLSTLSGPGRDQPLVLSWAAERAEALVGVGMSLVEAGAHFNSSDAVLSGSQLLEVIAAQPAARRVLMNSGAPNLLMQVVLSYAGANSSSAIVGGAARLLHELAAATAGGRAAPGSGGGAVAVAEELVKNLTARGLVAPLVREVRLGHPSSLGPSLELLVDLVRAGAERGRAVAGSDNSGSSSSSSSGGGDGDEGGAASIDAAREAVGAGILSLCAQLLFKASPDEQAHAACCYVVRHTDAHRKAYRSGDGAAVAGHGPPRGDEGGGGGGEQQQLLDGLDQQDGEGVAEGEDEGAARRPGKDDAPAAMCARSAEGRAALAKVLLQIMRETDFPDLRSAVLEACRDVAPSRPAAVTLVESGMALYLGLVLSHNTTKFKEEGYQDAAEAAWDQQSQRSAAALVALLALQGELRAQLVAEGALTGLVTAMRIYSGRQHGLGTQVRVTAAAALVPLLGEDVRYTRLAVAAGVLDPLVDMRLSGKEQEVQVAGRVMRALARADEDVAELFRGLGIGL